MPLDVSESALREAADAINVDYPTLDVHGVVGDFTAHLDKLPGEPPRIVAFLGGTIGNLLPGRARDLLRLGPRRPRARRVAAARHRPGEGSRRPWSRAYDDSAGVTAEFNRNVLRVINRQLGADFDVDAFSHVAIWDAENEWIEMHLRADRAMRVLIPEIHLEVDFAEGEELSTEISAKFQRHGVEAELDKAGFTTATWWTDTKARFALSLWQAT